jgi:hypothetical protein
VVVVKNTYIVCEVKACLHGIDILASSSTIMVVILITGASSRSCFLGARFSPALVLGRRYLGEFPVTAGLGLNLCRSFPQHRAFICGRLSVHMIIMETWRRRWWRLPGWPSTQV